MTVAAFFDLDKTLISRTSSVAFANQMRKDGLLSRSALAKLAWEHTRFMRHSGPEESMRLARSGLEMAKGRSQARARQLVSEHLESVISPLTFIRGVEIVEHHRDLGHLLAMVSSSPVDVVEPIARLFGMNFLVASIPEVDRSGEYTGALEFFSYGEHKVDAMRIVAESNGLDLARCWAYSDSITDLPMLEAVGNSVVVNADDELSTIATERGWKSEQFIETGHDWSHRPRSRHECVVVTPPH